jgi:NAD-dependent deacetylase
MNAYSSEILDAIDYAVELLREARHAIVLTGAGLSTPSGIPDFRSEGTGLWSHDEPLEVASLVTFRTRPELFFKWFRPLVGQIFCAKPNAAHLALAELEARGRLQAILTQNIDMLHHKAGSKRVFELHGTLRTLSCTQCYRRYASEDYLGAFIETGILPHCPECAALLKPDVILFGEQLPQRVMAEAQREARACDLVMVIGSSLEVLPVAGLPMQAIDRGAHLIIINNSPTYLNVRADVVLPQEISRILPAIAERVLHD